MWQELIRVLCDLACLNVFQPWKIINNSSKPAEFPYFLELNFHIISAILMRTSSRHFDEKKEILWKSSTFFISTTCSKFPAPSCLRQTFCCCGCWLSKQKRRNFLFHVGLTIFFALYCMNVPIALVWRSNTLSPTHKDG